MSKFPHYSVLLEEVIKAFESVSLNFMIDGTLGAGGHAQALLERHPEIEVFLGIDQDPDALKIASERLKPWGSKLILQHANFDQFDLLIKNFSLPAPKGILLDLGISSMQVDRPERGFSFMREGPLDMRMNPESELSAAEIVNTWEERDLIRIFRDYGEEKHARLAARAIAAGRQIHPIVSTIDLTRILNPVLGRFAKKGINPSTQVFQALRICVNRELEVLENALHKAFDLLAPGGRLAVISFHSLEDRIVKTHMRLGASDKWETVGLGGIFRDKQPTVALLTKKPMEAKEEERLANPRSRSAKMRVIEKLDNRHPAM